MLRLHRKDRALQPPPRRLFQLSPCPSPQRGSCYPKAREEAQLHGLLPPAAAAIFFRIASQDIHRHESPPLSRKFQGWWSRKARGASSGHSFEAILAAVAGESSPSQNHAQYSFHVSCRNIARADSQCPLPRRRRNSSLKVVVGQCRRAAAWIASDFLM